MATDYKQTYYYPDPDAPTPQNPKFREWRHWLVMNIPGSDIADGETCVSYVGAAPPKGSKPHRYVILGELNQLPGLALC